MESLYYHLTVKVHKKFLVSHAKHVNGYLATATVIASITKKGYWNNGNTPNVHFCLKISLRITRS